MLKISNKNRIFAQSTKKGLDEFRYTCLIGSGDI